MAFTGTPNIVIVAENIIRITGLSLAGSAAGTISMQEGTGEIKLPEAFGATPYEIYQHIVGLNESVDVTAQAVVAGGGGGSSGPDAAMFFGTTSGTGSTQNDYAATVAVGDAVPFPQDGPAVGTKVSRLSATQFTINVAGLYEVSWAVGFAEASQLELRVNGATLVVNSTATSGAGTQQNVNKVLVQFAAADVVELVNPPGNAAALTVQPADGSLTHAQAPNITFQAVEAAGAAGGGGAIGIAKTGADVATFLATLTNLNTTASAELEIYCKFHE